MVNVRDVQYEEWVRITTTAAVETELNLQIGTFTLKSNQTELLPRSFRDMRDFGLLFTASDRLQCAKVHEVRHMPKLMRCCLCPMLHLKVLLTCC